MKPGGGTASFVFVCLLAGATGCASESGGPCEQEGCPASEHCLDGVCLAGDSDPDDDGLATALELEWGLSALDPDSDGDGIWDGVEFGAADEPLDEDGDGLPDALESVTFDQDGDCIPDQWDVRNGEEDDLSTVAERVCPGTGNCAGFGGTAVCVGGVPVCDLAGVVGFEAEESTCDGQDNDCDGATDEGISFGGILLGGACNARGQCGDGIVECAPETGGAVCSTGPGGSLDRSEVERCDLVDNDCDGTTDEGMAWKGIALGKTCNGDGACGEGEVECGPDFAAICSTMAGGSVDESKEEKCDGLDNDCDGATDEELFLVDVSLCPLQGVCAKFPDKLVVSCHSGVWVCDPAGIESYSKGAEKWCDGQDNDCDGLTDEDFSVVDFDGVKKGLAESCGAGLCVGGKVVCSADGQGATCSTWNGMAQETCDSLDNDCDGVVDEDMKWEGTPLGQPCKGVGACGIGQVECSLSTGLATCSTNPGGTASMVQPEKCDLVDNDCDGQADEGIADPPPCVKPGVCLSEAPGAACEGGEWHCDYGFLPDWEAVETTCDGLDNDCDGVVDEGMKKLFAGGAVSVEEEEPPARRGYAVVQLPEGGQFFLHGGAGHSFPWLGEETCLADLWRFDGDSASWQQLPPGPVEGRWAHSLAWSVEEQSLFVVGGRCGGELIPSWRYSAAEQSWKPLDIPAEAALRFGHALFPRHGLGGFVVAGGRTMTEDAPSYLVGADGKLVPLPAIPPLSFGASCSNPVSNHGGLFGGEDPAGKLSAALVVVDLVTGQVKVVSDPMGPPKRRLASLACGPASFHLFGGVGEDGKVLGDVWTYSLADGAWIHEPTAPIARLEAVAAWAGDQLHLSGGFDEGGRFRRDRWHLSQGAYVQDGEEGPGGLAAAAHAMDPVGKRICMAGGLENGLSGSLPAMRLWCRDLVGGGWYALGDALETPAVFATLSYDPNKNRFLLLGGGQFPQGMEPQPLAPVCRFNAFNPLSGKWEEAGPCGEGPGAISSHTAVVRWKDLSLWVYGGLSPLGVSAKLWRYRLDLGQWEEATTTPPLPVRYGHAAVLREEQGQMLVVGGSPGKGSVLLVDLKELTLKELVALPWLESPFPVLFFDPVSQRGLVMVEDKTLGVELGLSGSDLSDLQTVTIAPGVSPVNLAASFYVPWERAGLRFGGIDTNGLATPALVRFATACE